MDFKGIEGYAGKTDLAKFDPFAVQIAGEDFKLTDEDWAAYCPALDEEVTEEFISDIERRGVVDPISVYRKKLANGDEVVVVLEGRRRTRAAREVWRRQSAKRVPEAERITLRAILRTERDQESLFGYNAGSDVKRLRTPGQRAKLAQWAMKHGMTIAKVAAAFGVHEQTIKNDLALVEKAAPALREAVENKEIPTRVANRMAALPKDKQEEALTKMRASGATSGTKAVRALEKAQKGRSDDIGKEDKIRMRSRLFLERVAEGWKKASLSFKVDAREMLTFVLGGRAPSGLPAEARKLLDAVRERHQSANAPSRTRKKGRAA